MHEDIYKVRRHLQGSDLMMKGSLQQLKLWVQPRKFTRPELRQEFLLMSTPQLSLAKQIMPLDTV